MADHICGDCGTRNDAAAQFCRHCDTYLGWDRGAATLDGEPLTMMIPTVVDSVATESMMADGGGDSPRTSDRPPSFPPTTGVPATSVPTNGAPTQTRAEAPLLKLRTPEVTLIDGAPASVLIEVLNPSTVVDAYVARPVNAPSWLSVRHDDVNLMPNGQALLTVEVGSQPGILVFAQRLHLRLVVSSRADPTKVANVDVMVTVPSTGPLVTVVAQPALVRLTDTTEGSFALHLDNRAANYPQAFRMSGSDPEAVVSFGFEPQMVQVPPGQMVEVRGRFRAPAPEPGSEVSRQLTLTAANDEGSASAVLTVQHRTSPPRADAPVTILLEPSELRLVDAGVAETDVIINNRAGHRTRHLSLSGRDPARAVGFFFLPQQVEAEPGQITRVRARVQTHAPAPGAQVVRQFTVVASDGAGDVEAEGVLMVSTSAAPIATAVLGIAPEHLTRANSSEGTFSLQVDNSRSTGELRVRLFGKDDGGVARFEFRPAEVVVPPRGVATAHVDVRAPRPSAGEQAVRTLTVTASDGTGAVEATARLTQVSSDRRPVWRVLLVILGALLVAAGALTSFSPSLDVVLPTPEWIEQLGRNPPRNFDLGDRSTLERIVQPPVRALLLACAVLMVFGLSGRGRLTRTMAILAVGLTVAFLVVASDFVSGLGIGVILIVLGSVLAYIGGVLSRGR
jgi:hypothetical protein